MKQESLNSYDEVPYPSLPYSQSHPDHLATIATLLGLTPPNRPYRVLELGCAAGGNLIPMAIEKPDCEFFGVDYSSQQIASGFQVVEELRIDNLELRAASILDIDESFGRFDYVLCHGVYSWVPSEVQEKILQICASQMTANGIAYISYNTHPGWRQRGAIRDMMRYHVSRHQHAAPKERILLARELLNFLVQATQNSDSAYGRMLFEQQELLRRHSDSYIFHEHLELHNEPLWFLDFCGRLDEHGLRYLGDSDFGSMVASMSFEPEVQEMLASIAPNLLEKEQYMDFVRNRAFRQTLICHASVKPNYDVDGTRLNDLFAASQTVARPSTDEEANVGQLEFALANGLKITTPSKSAQQALRTLGQVWPARVRVGQLVATSIQETQGTLPIDAEILDVEEQTLNLEASLLTAFTASSGRLLELSVAPIEPNEQLDSDSALCVNRYVQRSARLGQVIVNRRHDIVEVAPVDRHILPLLDGTRTPASILQKLIELQQSGELQISDEKDNPIDDREKVKSILEQILLERLRFYVKNSLCVS